jgi:uncharacterized membrane protein YedE/YeeE
LKGDADVCNGWKADIASLARSGNLAAMDTKFAAWLILVAGLLAGIGYQLSDVRKAWLARERWNTLRLCAGVVLFTGVLLYWFFRMPA